MVMTIGLLSAQAPISYVASVRPNNSGDARALVEYSPGGRLSATAVTVRALLRTAYRVQDYQIPSMTVGVPWRPRNLDSDGGDRF
jgi:hypothetical protein